MLRIFLKFKEFYDSMWLKIYKVGWSCFQPFWFLLEFIW